MRQFMMTITALTAFGALVATAQAEILGGAPMKNGTQCFQYTPGNSKDARFGSWGACPQAAGSKTAATATTPRSTRRSRAAASPTSPTPSYPHESAQ
jgi:hypothetical protein